MAIRDLLPRRPRNDIADPIRDPFTGFRTQMDRLFDDFFNDFGAGRFASPSLRSSYAPAWPSIELNETDSEYRVTAEIPGLEEKDINLSLRDNMLSISGESAARPRATLTTRPAGSASGSTAASSASFPSTRKSTPTRSPPNSNRVC